MANDFKLDDVTSDSDLSLMERKFERGGDIYTGLLDTALGAAQKWGEIQQAKDQKIKVEEDYRTKALQSITYDAQDTSSVLKAEKRIMKMGEEKVDASKMPVYSQQWQSAYNKIQRDKNANKNVKKLVDEVYTPVVMGESEDGGEQIVENYSVESFIEGGFYDSQGIEGQALIDKIDEGIRYYGNKSRSLQTMSRLDKATDAHLQGEMDKLGFLKSFVAGGKTITDEEFSYAMQGQTLTQSYDRASDSLDNKYREIEMLKDKMLRTTGEDVEGYLAMADEDKTMRYREMEADVMLKEGELGELQRTSDLLYDELNQSYVSNRVGAGDGSDTLNWSTRTNKGGDDETAGPTQFKTVVNDKKDITSNTAITYINANGEEDEMRLYDLNKSVSKLSHVANKTPKSLHSTTGNEDLIETYNVLKNIPEDSLLWEYKVGGKTLKKHYKKIDDIMKTKPSNLPADDGKPVNGNTKSFSVAEGDDISKLTQDQRKGYFGGIEAEYEKSYANQSGMWDTPYEFKVKSTKNGDFVDFTFGAGNFIDKANRDNRNVKVKYDDGKPYVTIESQWGNNDEHTIWLDDQTWKDMGFANQGDYIRNAIQYKGDSKYLKELGHKHMGD